MQRISYCSLLLALVGFFFKLDIPTLQPQIEKLTTKNAHITLVIHQGTITLIDSGAIGRQASAESYVEYTLLPTITKLSGALHLDTLVLLHPTKRLFLAIAHLSNLIPIKKIYLVSWEKQIVDRAFWRSFWTFKDTIEKNKCDLKRIGAKDHTILVSPHSTLILTSIGTFKKYGAKMPQFNAYLSAHHTKYSLK
jgi:hypothetical protein